jgi:hypothetical protein
MGGPLGPISLCSVWTLGLPKSSDSSAFFLFGSGGDPCKSGSMMVKTAAKAETLSANEARFGLLEITPFEGVKLCFSQ